MPEKVKKEAKSVVILIYPGGVKVQLETTHTMDEAVQLLRKKPEVVLDSTDDSASIIDERTIVYTDKLLFAHVLIPNNSALVVAGPGQQQLAQSAADLAARADGILRVPQRG